jgi:choline dehydrogenase-like flavoprotein
MRKHEKLEITTDAVSDPAMAIVDEYHGKSGPIAASFNDSWVPVSENFVTACEEVTGIRKKARDAWSGDHIGFAYSLGTVYRTGPNKGKRSYAARGYFEDNAHRENLHVLCDAMVTKIVLDGHRATGVNFVFAGSTHQIGVNREVIVSCGSIQSPQILELSGIGDPDVLKKAGVECKIVNKGIGANYQDHAMGGAIFEVHPEVVTAADLFKPEAMAAAQKALMEEQSGPLTHAGATMGFFPYKLFASADEQEEVLMSIEKDMDKVTPFQRKQYERIMEHLKDDRSANLQVVMVPLMADYENGVGDQSAFIVPPAPGAPVGISMSVCVQYVLSRGTVHIKSSDPFDPPLIDPAFLEHPADEKLLAAGIKVSSARISKNDSSAEDDCRWLIVCPRRSTSSTRSLNAGTHVRSWICRILSRRSKALTSSFCRNIIPLVHARW